MRQFRWLILGLAFAPWLGRPSAADAAPAKVGVGPAYEQLGKLAVMHLGRIKPLDTMAREEVKQVFGRETIKLHDAKGEVVQTWGPVAAFFDWSVRPEFWNDQPIILVDYLPLKRKLLAGAIGERLGAIAANESTSPADRDAAKALMADEALSAAALSKFARQAKITAEDRTEIDRLAGKLSEDHRWLSARELEEADVLEEGQKVPFERWFRQAANKGQQADNDPTGATKLTDVEKRAIEVGTRLVHFQTHRDREIRSIEPLLVMPRPSNPTYLAFTAETVKKARELGQEGVRDLPLMELDALKALSMYWNDLPGDDRKVPGVDAKFDAKFTAWLKQKSGWVPLRVLLDTKPDLLERAGYPSAQVTAFLDAFRALEKAETSSPGTVPQTATSRLVATAHDLGGAVNKITYPSPKVMAREAYYNEANPFWNAQYAYGLALILLAVSLGHSGGRKTLFDKFGLALYAGGMLALATGIGLEIFGFTMRVLISQWAPVTNMYETVIWVALVTAVLGLIFELIYRRTFAALAASGVALLGTVLAAKVPLWDTNIKTLEPVLRSNYWLTIHVLTEVSSYAAFALAMGLGVIAVMYYLSATYKRSPSYLELTKPLVAGVPLLALGTAGLAASYGYLGSQWTGGQPFFYAALGLWGAGFLLTVATVVAMLGEFVNRTFFPLPADLDDSAIAGNESAAEASTISAQSAGESKAARAGGVATVAKPTVAEMRARAAQNRPKLDARGLAMQATAAKIKPLSNFIYRTMQVGVLLIAAGTILGGVWADYSWGRFWGWDPKEVWALITLLVYLIPLHGRFAGWVNTFGLVMASIVCFMSVVMAWYGVNFVLGVGLHSYGFTEGGGQGLVSVVCLAVIAFAAGAGWRRWVASRVPAPVA